VGVESGLDVAEHRVVESERAADFQHGVAQAGHVEEEGGAGLLVEFVERADHRVRAEERVAGQQLRRAEDRPAGRHACDDARVIAAAGLLDESVDRGHGCSLPTRD
jgi:hypothetical protein